MGKQGFLLTHEVYYKWGYFFFPLDWYTIVFNSDLKGTPFLDVTDDLVSVVVYSEDSWARLLSVFNDVIVPKNEYPVQVITLI